jgi:tripartite-type tricarboxylate transporter receptor subunit TctC
VRHLASDDMKDQLERQGVEARGTTPKEFADFIRAELAKWGKVVKDSGAKVD